MPDTKQYASPLSPNPFRIVVAAGGTGGHIFPAVAVVEQLRTVTDESCSVLFLGSADRMEATLIPKLGYPFASMPIAGFKGLRSASTITLPIKVLRSIAIARKAIRAFKPNAVICTGGYVSYPVGVAAAREGVPLFVLESNFNPGKTNARLARRATKTILSFDDSIKFYRPQDRSRLVVLGNPVRSQIDTDITPSDARIKWRLHPNKRTVFVFGGSLGARSLNNAIASALPLLASAPYQVLWQTGAKYDIPANLPANVVATHFIDDMGAAYRAADLVVCRSGATSVAELGITGVPAILVPLPSASTGEQQHNAMVVQDAGAAIVVADASTAGDLVSQIDKLMKDEESLAHMAVAMKKLGRPTATEDTARLILTTCNWPIGGTQ